jgi:hypothetical protein
MKTTSMTEDHKTALRLAGEMADAAVRLVGGKGLNFNVTGCAIGQLSEYAERLKIATEKYNEHIIAMTLKKDQTK